MLLSQRVLNTQFSPIRKLTPYAEKARKEGKKIYYLNIGQPDVETPKEFFEGIKKYSSNIVYYSHSAGLYELREAFSDYYKSWNIDFNPEELIVTTGGSEAVIFSLATVADPGDEVIVIEPFYANYKGFAEMLDVKLRPVKADPETGYAVPSREEFEKAYNNKVKAIIFSNPSNPTGAVYDFEEVKRIVDFAKEKDIFVISDEVYKEFTFDGKEHISLMDFEDKDRFILVDSVSKRYSLCGARIGVLASKNKKVMEQVMKFAQSRLSPPLMAQFGLLGLLKNLESDYLIRMQKEYQDRRDAVYEEISMIEGAVFKKPHGAFYFSVKLPVDDSEEFIKWMLTDFNINGETVMVSPLSGFYATPDAGKQEIRIAYVLNSDELRKACRILREAITTYNKR
ncbi:aspartate aminotransferase [Petrotoga sp. 9PW.55.5.1]|uniref:pyridoxal phosphate-dependent aminotransferase n=1 Tax=Petrotoga sp. 9PW.55.5.1 TaxID=1308979 RepID=UPI000DC5BBE6|nr:pyridoxal phosphate-dependent aminotransferase [Petrotoga sp. 9PW.55.5.1]RAP00010.1 aspartate aminotransferase [Petrotoga sp. 9PW.55.5.1]